jgi:diguanylate cyclase
MSLLALLEDCPEQYRLACAERDKLKTTNLSLQQQVQSLQQELGAVANRGALNPYSGLPGLPSLHSRLDQLCTSLGRQIAYLLIIKIGPEYEQAAKTLKESAAEWILYQASLRICEATGPQEQVFHLSETEFAALWLPDHEPDLHKRLQGLHRALNHHHALAGVRLHISAHIGVARYPDHGRQGQDLIDSARLARAMADRDKIGFVIFAENIRQDIVDRMALQNDILKALEAHSIEGIQSQFRLVYQPQVSLQADKQGNLRIADIHAEALLRWEHPTRGPIPPDRFIPLAEETGLIQPLGTWLVYRAAAQIEAWQGTALDQTIISINVSPRQFLNDQLVYSLDRLIRHNPRVAQRMKLEITENSLLHNTDTCLRYMHHLRSLGLQFAVDDFGRDYSSLSYLSRLPVSTIKIDRSFINNIHQNRHNQIIVRAIAGLARDLNLKVIVEGVENSQQLAFLLNAHCTTIQGFFFSKPLESQQFINFHQRALRKRVNLPEYQAPAHRAKAAPQIAGKRRPTGL